MTGYQRKKKVRNEFSWFGFGCGRPDGRLIYRRCVLLMLYKCLFPRNKNALVSQVQYVSMSQSTRS